MLTDGSSSNGWVIALGVIAPILLILLVFEFVTFIVQVRNTVFRKPKKFEWGMILTLVIGVFCMAIAIVLTVYNDGSVLGYVIEWWVFTASIFGLALARFLINLHEDKHHRINSSVCLDWKVDEIASYLKVKDYQNTIAHHDLVKGTWLNNVNAEYEKLRTTVSAIDHTKTERSQLFSTVADLVIFQEKYVVSLLKKRRNYVNALFINLLAILRRGNISTNSTNPA